MSVGNLVQRAALPMLTALVLLPSVANSTAIAKVPLVQIGANKIKVEVASTPAQIQRGLMYRNSMAEDHGMVFLFRPASGVRFWMAHCFMSLDMLMVNDGKIVRIFEDVPPCKAANEADCATYPGKEEEPVVVTEVVEVNAGYAKRHGIKTGDSVTFLLGNQWARSRNKSTASGHGDSGAGK